LGKRVPVSLKVFITALAIGDDIGAILVVALFYTSQINVLWLGVAAVLLLFHLFLNFVKFPYPIFYVLIIFVVWFAIFESGVHATVAGIIMAFAVPGRPRKMPLEFITWSRRQLRQIEEKHDPDSHHLNHHEQQEVVGTMQTACYDAQSPLLRLERSLHPLASFIILPLFAFANAGVQIGSSQFAGMVVSPVGLGIILGLLVGKQVGITLFAFLAVKMDLADLPDGVSFKHIYGASWLAGIGFTMSIFIGGLAFGHDSGVLDQAKLAILTSSVLAGVGGYLFLHRANSQKT
jgi:NhaA family Na+:H+ antiporter